MLEKTPAIIKVEDIYSVPVDANADGVALLVKQILVQRNESIQELAITPKEIRVTKLVKSTEPPYGEVPTDGPEDLWSVITSSDMHEAGDISNIPPQIVEALSKLLHALRATNRTGVAWVVYNASVLGITGISKLSTLWGLPVFESDRVDPTRILLICGKGKDIPFELMDTVLFVNIGEKL